MVDTSSHMRLHTNKAASVSEAMGTRISVRAFLDKPVGDALLQDILNKALRAPSGGNLQAAHVHVLRGHALGRLKNIIAQHIENDHNEGVLYGAYPSPLWEPLRTRRYKVGEDLYAILGIGRGDKSGRLRQFARNFMFFNAPIGIIITGDKRLERPQYLDIGIYLQSVMLLAREAGLHTIAQGAWRNWPDTLQQVLDLVPTDEVIVGLSMGYGDANAPINTLYSDRVELTEMVSFYD